MLASEKKILEEILDNLPGTFNIWDDRPRIIRWNKRHDEISDYSADDYVDMLPNDFFGENEHRIIEAAVEKTFSEGEVTVEATLVTKSGKKIPHVYTAVQTKMGDKPVLMGSGIDITEPKKTEQQLRDALTEVEAMRNQLEADGTSHRHRPSQPTGRRTVTTAGPYPSGVELGVWLNSTSSPLT